MVYRILWVSLVNFQKISLRILKLGNRNTQ